MAIIESIEVRKKRWKEEEEEKELEEEDDERYRMMMINEEDGSLDGVNAYKKKRRNTGKRPGGSNAN